MHSESCPDQETKEKETELCPEGNGWISLIISRLRPIPSFASLIKGLAAEFR
jgi:hypothetical protein